MKEYSFEKLDVWSDIRDVIKSIYALTKKFPEDEKFGLVSQMRRSAISIGSNIAEGTGRNTMKDQAYFSQVAYSSLLELLAQLTVSIDLGFIDEEKYVKLRQKIESTSYKINALRNSQLRRQK